MTTQIQIQENEPVGAQTRRSLTADVLAAGLAGIRTGGDITGTQGRRLRGVTEHELAAECYSAVVMAAADGQECEGALEALAALARSGHRRGQRDLVGDATDFNAALADSAAEYTAMQSDELTFPAKTQEAWQFESSDAGKIMILVGGKGYNGRTEQIGTGRSKRYISQVPTGGIVGSVARYTLRKLGNTLSEDVKQECAACATAAIWAAYAGTYGELASSDLAPEFHGPIADHYASMASMDGGCDIEGCRRALWRIGWRAARRCVIAESRAGKTGRGSDRLPADAVYDATRECVGWQPSDYMGGDPEAASLADLASLADWQGASVKISNRAKADADMEHLGRMALQRGVIGDACKSIIGDQLAASALDAVRFKHPSAIPDDAESYRVNGVHQRMAAPHERAGTKSLLKEAAQWLAGVMGANLEGGLGRHHSTVRSCKMQWRALVNLLACQFSNLPQKDKKPTKDDAAAAREARWERAAKAGGFASADSLRESLAAGKVWERLKDAALECSELSGWLGVYVDRDGQTDGELIGEGEAYYAKLVVLGQDDVDYATSALADVPVPNWDADIVLTPSLRAWRIGVALAWSNGDADAVRAALAEPVPMVRRAVGRDLTHAAARQAAQVVLADAKQRYAVAAGLLSRARASRIDAWTILAKTAFAGRSNSDAWRASKKRCTAKSNAERSARRKAAREAKA